MEAPKNLVDAVSRLKPQVILVLDTNVVMNNPRLDLYWNKVATPFILVVPHVVELELRVLKRGGKDEGTREKASCALDSLSTVYAQGNASTGIELGRFRWLISVNVPKSMDSNAQVEQLIHKKLGNADAALLKLAEICRYEFLDALTVLITEDQFLTLVAILKNQSVYKFSDLQSAGALEKLLGATRPSKLEDVDISELIDFGEERLVKIAMTLEVLRNEKDDLVASGSGRLTDGEERYPFRWTFPYQNLAIYNLSDDDVPISTEYAVMPLENVDFMGADDKIPEEIRRYVCSMLEEAYESKDLQSPLTKVRASMLFNTHMGITRGGVPFDYPLSEELKQGRKPEDAERYEELRIAHNRYVNSLFDGSAKSVSEAYRSAFQLSERLDSFWDGIIDDEYDGYNWNVELSLMEFLDVALEAWVVGETREAEYTYRPFAWPEDEVEAVVDDEGEQGEESE